MKICVAYSGRTRGLRELHCSMGFLWSFFNSSKAMIYQKTNRMCMLWKNKQNQRYVHAIWPERWAMLWVSVQQYRQMQRKWIPLRIWALVDGWNDFWKSSDSDSDDDDDENEDWCFTKNGTIRRTRLARASQMRCWRHQQRNTKYFHFLFSAAFKRKRDRSHKRHRVIYFIAALKPRKF